MKVITGSFEAYTRTDTLQVQAYPFYSKNTLLASPSCLHRSDSIPSALIIRLANTWLTCASVLLPNTPNLWKNLILHAVQFDRIYFAPVFIRVLSASVSACSNNLSTASWKSVFVFVRMIYLNKFLPSSALSRKWVVIAVIYLLMWYSSMTLTIPAILFLPCLIQEPPSEFR